MKRFLIFLFVILFISPLLVQGKETTKEIDALVIRYDNRINEGHDLKISIQVRFNMSYLEVIIEGKNTTFTAYSAKFASFTPNDFIDFTIDSQYLSAGQYKGRALAKYQNSTIPAVYIFFQFTVNKVLSTTETILALIIIMLFIMLPFLYDYDKKRLEDKSWNILTTKQYLKIRFQNKLLMLPLFLFLLGGWFLFRLIITTS